MLYKDFDELEKEVLENFSDYKLAGHVLHSMGDGTVWVVDSFWGTDTVLEDALEAFKIRCLGFDYGVPIDRNPPIRLEWDDPGVNDFIVKGILKHGYGHYQLNLVGLN